MNRNDDKSAPAAFEAEATAQLSNDDTGASAGPREITVPQDSCVATIIAALSQLSGDDARAVLEAMPQIAGNWSDRGQWGSRLNVVPGGIKNVEVADWEFFENIHLANDAYAFGWTEAAPYQACVYVERNGPTVTWHATQRRAQAWCDAHLQAAGVLLCGEIVTEDDSDG